MNPESISAFQADRTVFAVPWPRLYTRGSMFHETSQKLLRLALKQHQILVLSSLTVTLSTRRFPTPTGYRAQTNTPRSS